MKRLWGCATIAALLLPQACTLGRAPIQEPKAVAGAHTGGTITIAIGRPQSIDPANSFEPWGRLVDSLICEPLISIDPVTGNPKPAIAESWIVGSNGSQITIKLRKNVRYSDGRVMTPDDAVFALSRVASEEEGSNVASLLRPVIGWAQVHGDIAARNPEESSSLSGVQVVGSDAIQITLSEPRADFYRLLSQPLASPVSRAIVTRDPTGFESNPICAGPYKLEKPWQQSDSSIALIRNPNYYARDLAYTRGGSGYADRVELRVTDAAGASASIVSGAAEAAPLTGTASPPSQSADIATGQAPYLDYIGLPVTVPPFDKREVRLALSQAIDRTAISRDVFGGARAPAQGFVPPSIGGVYRADACGAGAPATADAAAAARSLASAAQSLRGRDITLSYNTDFRNAALVQTIASQWQSALGVHVRLKPIAWDRYLDQAKGPAGFDGPFRMGWQMPYPGPDAALAPLFASSNIGTDNFTRFADPRFDSVLNRHARTASSEDDLRAQYQRLEDIACEQMPAIPIVFGGARIALRHNSLESARGSLVDVSTGMLAIRELFVRP